MTERPNSGTAHHREKLSADDPRAREAVAVPVMQAVDAMPSERRALVHEYSYVDVYRAWRFGLLAAIVRRLAEQNGGVFVL